MRDTGSCFSRRAASASMALDFIGRQLAFALHRQPGAVETQRGGDQQPRVGFGRVDARLAKLFGEEHGALAAIVT